MSLKAKPIEDQVLQGIQQRLEQTFSCPVVLSNSNDKLKVLERMGQGRPQQYPYMFATLQSMSPNVESYVTSRFARAGVMAVINDEGIGYNVRMLPTNFDYEIEFVTNRFQDIDQGSVLSFVRRWLFARRCGYLKFNINYGRLNLPIGVTMSDSVTVPSLENKTETETSYVTTTSLVIHGWVSEPELKQSAVIQSIEIDGQVVDASGRRPGGEFRPF